MNFFSLIIALIALSLSLFQYKFSMNIIPENMITIIGICTTLIVGIHIFDYFQLKCIENKQKKLDNQLREVEKRLNEFNSNIWILKGISLATLEPYLAFHCFCEALKVGMKDNDAVLCNKSLKNMTQIITLLRKRKNKNKYINKNGFNERDLKLEELVKGYKLYPVFCNQINQTITAFQTLSNK